MQASDFWHGSSRAERDAGRRARLFETALEIYGTQGFRSTAVQTVCQRAEVSTRSFYELFTNQDELLEQLYALLVDEVIENLGRAQIPAEATLLAAAQQFVATGLASILDDERKLRVLEIEVVGATAVLEQQRRQAMRALAVAIDQAIAQLSRAYVADFIDQDHRDALTDAKVETGVFVVGGLTEMLIQRAYTDVVQRSSYDAFLHNVTGHILRSYGFTPEQHGLLPTRLPGKD